MLGPNQYDQIIKFIGRRIFHDMNMLKFISMLSERLKVKIWMFCMYELHDNIRDLSVNNDYEWKSY
jgi:hypothetical protein